MSYDTLRQTMIDTQIRTWDVLDPKVLQAVATTRREIFVPTALRHLAFADFCIPLGQGEVMWTPKMEARVLQELDLNGSDRVLEIGTGSGYFAALLARLAGVVHTVEDRADLLRPVEGRLHSEGIQGVHLHQGDGSMGWAAHAPYDAICITGSLPRLPEIFLEQLGPGGRLIAIIGSGAVMEVLRLQKDERGVLRRESLFETQIPPLRHHLPGPGFQF
ncbi:MAG: protein-L-isoaspartate O-methyltransferase family protein [Acidithiobacillus sp.]|uniref:protein-L-isoaspartate O-methyltransferase family protein n=1 Tax=Acidithiobacillus sp. TaxID=1872118 RepID=UPI0025C0CFC5|nr:protein-L-isoaspartate O-methyltransferase [Acidithiobacillus sp.]